MFQVVSIGGFTGAEHVLNTYKTLDEAKRAKKRIQPTQNKIEIREVK